MPKRWAAPVKDEVGDGARLKEERVIKKIKVKQDVKEEEPDAQWWWHNKEGVKEEKEQTPSRQEIANKWIEWAQRQKQRTGNPSSSTSPSS